MAQPPDLILDMDTENKNYWVEEYGIKKETEFCNACNVLGVPLKINPNKTFDKYAPDLLYGNMLADLKYSGTPFYTSKCPQWTVSFNHKDYVQYIENYPNIGIFLWVNYPDSYAYNVRVNRIHGIYYINFAKLADLITGGIFPSHEYKKRVNDNMGNAKSSYLIYLKHPEIKTLYESLEVT